MVTCGGDAGFRFSNSHEWHSTGSMLLFDAEKWDVDKIYDAMKVLYRKYRDAGHGFTCPKRLRWDGLRLLRSSMAPMVCTWIWTTGMRTASAGSARSEQTRKSDCTPVSTMSSDGHATGKSTTETTTSSVTQKIAQKSLGGAGAFFVSDGRVTCVSCFQRQAGARLSVR